MIGGELKNSAIILEKLFSHRAFQLCVHKYTYRNEKVIQITSQVAENFCQFLFLKVTCDHLDCTLHELLEFCDFERYRGLS